MSDGTLGGRVAARHSRDALDRRPTLAPRRPRARRRGRRDRGPRRAGGHDLRGRLVAPRARSRGRRVGGRTGRRRTVRPAHAARRRHVPPRGQPRRDDARPPARRARDRGVGLPALVRRDGRARPSRGPDLHDPPARVLHGARPLQRGAPRRAPLPAPGRLPPGRDVPLRAAGPVRPGGRPGVRGGARRCRGRGARRAGARAAPRPRGGPLDGGRQPVGRRLDHRGGVGSARGAPHRPAERGRAACAGPVLPQHRGRDAHRAVARAAPRPARDARARPRRLDAARLHELADDRSAPAPDRAAPAGGPGAVSTPTTCSPPRRGPAAPSRATTRTRTTPTSSATSRRSNRRTSTGASTRTPGT